MPRLGRFWAILTYIPAVFPFLLAVWVLLRLFLFHQLAIKVHFCWPCVHDPSGLAAASSSPIFFLFPGPLQRALTKSSSPAPLFLYGPITVSSFLLTNSFKYGRMVYTTKASAHENSLVLGQPDFGVQNLAFVYTAPNQSPTVSNGKVKVFVNRNWKASLWNPWWPWFSLGGIAAGKWQSTEECFQGESEEAGDATNLEGRGRKVLAEV